MEIKKCPPGAAKGAYLQRWPGDEGAGAEPVHPRRAERFANSGLSQWEEAVLNTVLHLSRPVSQRELATIVAERLGMKHSQVYNAAQRLAENGNICRMKVGRSWQYWSVGSPAPKKQGRAKSGDLEKNWRPIFARPKFKDVMEEEE